MKEKKKFKNDVNFLEYPMWIVNNREEIKEFSVVRKHGSYKITTGADRLPDRVDKILLLYLLNKISEGDFSSSEIVTTRYHLSKEIYGPRSSSSKPRYDRVMQSLKRWAGIVIEFSGTFYEGDNYTARFFGVVDDVICRPDDNYLYIKFNQQFIDQMKNTEYYKYVDYEEYKRLRKPVSARLYEILIKTFKGRYHWKVNASSLGEKLTLSKTSPSQVLEKVEPALREINNQTELNVRLSTYKKTDKTVIFVFSKDGHLANGDTDYSVNLQTVLAEIPEKFRTKTVEKIVREYSGNLDVLLSNVEYTNTKNPENYVTYLLKAIEKDWAIELRSKRNSFLESKAEEIRSATQILAKDFGLRFPPGEIEKLARSAALRMEADGVVNDYIIAEFIAGKARSIHAEETEDSADE